MPPGAACGNATAACLEVKLVEAGHGDKSIQLTAEAKAIIERFDRLEKDVETLLREANFDFKTLFKEAAGRYMSKKT